MLNESKSIENLPLEDLEFVDAACDSVSQSWKQGEPSRIEELLAGASDSLRKVLLTELVRTEVELRIASGQPPTAAEYMERFPQWKNELQTCVELALTVPLIGIDKNCMQAISHRFEVLGLLGRGGMGVVVRARDLKLDREVAVKLLAPELTRDPLAKQRFLREARLAAAVRHDNIVTIYSADEINSVAMIEMELVEGESLAKKIQREGPFSIEDIIEISIQIASGLEAAHGRGMIHRDIKPANILLEDSNRRHATRVKITDFGLARATSDVSLTRTGIVIGTPEYISPEQAEALPLDHRTDLFSLGCVMYSLCTGKTAFQAESIISILRLIADREPTPIRQINTNVPTWLINVIEKLMAKKPIDRFQSASELVEALRNKGLRNTSSVSANRSLQWTLIPVGILAIACLLFTLSYFQKEQVEKKQVDGSVIESSKDATNDERSSANPHPLVSDDYEWSEPINLGPEINTLNNEENACLSADGFRLIFNRINSEGYELFESNRDNENAMFGPAESIQADFNRNDADSSFLSYDGLSIYFALAQPNDSRDRDLWVSKRSSLVEPWGPALNLGPSINTSNYEQTPWVSRDELTLIFSRARNGDFRLHQAKRSNVNEDFGEAIELANVNAGDCSSFPRITQDGLLLLFVHCARGSNQVGLWTATRRSVNDDFGAPTPLGPIVNGGRVTSGPSLSSDERTIIYSTRSNEPGDDNFDLWSVTRVPKSKQGISME